MGKVFTETVILTENSAGNITISQIYVNGTLYSSPNINIPFPWNQIYWIGIRGDLDNIFYVSYFGVSPSPYYNTEQFVNNVESTSVLPYWQNGQLVINTYSISVTVSNSQPIATPAPFDQFLNITESQIASALGSTTASQLWQQATSDYFLNLLFQQNGQTLYAWVQNYTSSWVAVWVKLPNGIPASSSVTINIYFMNSIQYPYTGIAPQLTPTYGQYDNGGNVFLFYDNFAGTTLSSKWVTGVNGGSYTVNNGLTITLPYNAPSGSYVYISTSSFTVNSPQIVESYANLNGFNTANFRMVPIALTEYNNVPWEADLGKNENAVGWVGDAQAINTVSAETTTVGNVNVFQSSQITSTSAYQLWGIIYPNNGSVTVQYNYNNWGSTTTYVPPLPLYITISNYIYPAQSSFTTTYPINVYYVRARAYPPNGVMPSNSQPQKTIILLG